MKRLLLLSFLIVGVCLPVLAQNPCSQGTPYRNCRACGSATSTKGKKLNVLKNRGREATNPQKITVEQIRNPANNGVFTPSRKVWIVGYVASLDNGGFKETCNCGREDLRDIHINIVADPSERDDKAKYVVVEITPRWQARFGMDDSVYATMKEKLRQEIEHKWVRFEGWMLTDAYHATESKTTANANTPTCRDDGHDPQPCVWRSSPWEVHPVTAYRVVPAP